LERGLLIEGGYQNGVVRHRGRRAEQPDDIRKACFAKAVEAYRAKSAGSSRSKNTGCTTK
jgi:hypothetical protein